MAVPTRKLRWHGISPRSQSRLRKTPSQYDETLKQRRETRPFKLLLSSYGFNSPMMREKFAKVIHRDESLQNKTCLVLAYAGFDTEKTFEREKQGLVDFGFSPDKIKFVRSRFDIDFRFPDYIYVPGGDPFKLLKSLREMGILHDIVDCVREKRAVYIGVSAGAYIAAKSIEYAKQVEDNNVINDKRFGALGLISEMVLCHYDHYSYATLKACQQFEDNAIVTINDDQLLMYEDDKFSYVD